MEGLVLSPDPLHYPEVFQEKSQLQTQGCGQCPWAEHGRDGDTGLGEAIALASPSWLLGQPVPIHSFLPGERNSQPCC